MVALGWQNEANAKVSFDSGYTIDQTYNAALRFVRVDLGLTVTEKDPKAAYIMFDYKHPEAGNKTTPGSIEVLPAGNVVKVHVQLPAMPRYHEQVLVNGLQKKLRDDYGEPPSRPAPAPPSAQPSASSPQAVVPSLPL